jgi:hypothetical protein
VEANWKSEVSINNCSGPRNGFAVYLGNSTATVYDSQISFINSGGNSVFLVHNSSVTHGLDFVGGRDQGYCENCTIYCIYASSFQGAILMNDVVFTSFKRGPFPMILDSSFEIMGNITFPNDQYVSDWSGYGNEWKNSRIARDYDIIISNGTVPLGNVVLKLYDSAGFLVWNGMTDALGEDSFEIVFCDVNYTSRLELEAIKEDWSGRVNVTLYSRTPILIATKTYQTDLNVDGKVDILDITVVATAYGSHGPNIPNSGDPPSEKWIDRSRFLIGS